MIGHILRVRYEVLHEAGEDPVFACYGAKDRSTGRNVLLRVVKEPFSRERAFLDEVQQVVHQVRSVQHPAVEQVYSFEEDHGTWFVVCEAAVDPTLDERIKRLTSLSASVSVAHAVGVCEALEALHLAGVIHGDVSARNVSTSPEGAVKLRRAGVWSCYSHSTIAGPLMLGLMAPYLAPEVTEGGMPSPAADLYALGILLYQMLLGHPPFSGENAVAIAIKHATAPVPSLRGVNRSIPVVLDEIVRKAVSKDPAHRYPNASAMLRDLRALHDAMRFGRMLTWPIPAKDAAPAQPVPVAPRMNVIEANSPQRSAPDQDFEVESLPVWLRAVGWTALAAFLMVVGAWAFFNVQKPQLETVPNLVGMTKSEAAARLDNMNLKLRVVRRETSEDFAEDTVVSVSPVPGRQVREHSFVDAVVSAGSRFVELPDLRGRSLEESRRLLGSLGLDIQEPVEERSDRDLDAGLVLEQVPEPRKSIERGTKVRLVVSSGGASRGPQEEPSGGARHVYTLRLTMPPGEQSVLVRIDMTDERGTRTVYEERHEPGERFEVAAEGVGGEATFRIFFDGRVVRQVTERADEAGG